MVVSFSHERGTSMFDGATEGQQKHLEIIATKEQYAKAEVKT